MKKPKAPYRINAKDTRVCDLLACWLPVDAHSLCAVHAGRLEHAIANNPHTRHTRPPTWSTAWADDAACKGLPDATEIFFPQQGEASNGHRFCKTCPVSGDCLAAGLTERCGTWSVPEKNRRRIRKHIAQLATEQ